MKAIFIDIDGVLNHLHDKERYWSQDERFGLAPDLVGNLKTILDAVPDARLVISSSWRVDDTNPHVGGGKIRWRDELLRMLDAFTDVIWGGIATLHEFGPPNVSGAKGRAHDILLWLSEYGGGDPFVVLDDGGKELKRRLGGHVVDCGGPTCGLTAERAQAAIAVLRAGNDVPKPNTSCACEGGC